MSNFHVIRFIVLWSALTIIDRSLLEFIALARFNFTMDVLLALINVNINIYSTSAAKRYSRKSFDFVLQVN